MTGECAHVSTRLVAAPWQLTILRTLERAGTELDGLGVSGE